jgi:branched-chain amino acid transport system substrate-binding protein
LGAVLAIGLIAAGCGGDDDDAATTAAPTTSAGAATTAAPATTGGAATTDAGPASTASATSAATETTAAELSGDPVKVGVIMSMSGPVAFVAGWYKPVIEMWLAEHEATGIDGHPIEVVYRDDESTAEGAANAARQLIDDDKVDVVVGPEVSVTTSGALPLLNDAKIATATLSAFVPAGDPTQFPYAFPFEFSSAHTATAYVRVMKQTGVTKFGYLGPNDTTGNAVAKVVQAAAAEAGVELVDTEFFEPGSTDVTTQLEKLQSAGVEAIASGDTLLPSITTTLQGITTLGWDVKIVGVSAWADYSLVKNGDLADAFSNVLATGVSKASSCNPLSADVQDWRSRYLAATGKSELDNRLYLYMRPYEALSFLKDVIEATHGTDTDAIKPYMDGQKTWTGLAATYTFDATSHVGQTEDVTVSPSTWDNGAFTCIES